MALPCSGQLSIQDIYDEATVNGGYTGGKSLSELAAFPRWYPSIGTAPYSVSDFYCKSAYGDFRCIMPVDATLEAANDSALAPSGAVGFFAVMMRLYYTDGTTDDLYPAAYDNSDQIVSTLRITSAASNGYFLFRKTTLTKTIDYMRLYRVQFDTPFFTMGNSSMETFDDTGGYTIEESTYGFVVSTGDGWGTHYKQDGTVNFTGGPSSVLLTILLSLDNIYDP